MGKPMVSVDSNDSDNENAEIESDDVSEEEPSEEDPLEEDPDEDEPQEINSCEEPDEDPCVPNEDNLCEQELDGGASCEEEPNEIDSCGSPNEDECTGNQNEESCEEEPYEEGEQYEEEMEEEPCEEPEEDRQREEQPMEEPCEESEDKQCEEEPIGHCEEPDDPSEEESEEEEPEEEELGEDLEEESAEGSPANQSSNKNDVKSAQSNSEKMKISSDMASDPKKISKTSGVSNSSTNLTVPIMLSTTASTGKKRQSKWDVKVEANELAEGGGNATTKKRKSRWSRWSIDDSQSSLQSSLKHPVIEIDLEIPKLYAELLDINKKLQSGVVDDRSQRERSPSPPPIYNNLGIKINTRESRVRSKLTIQRQAIISELIQRNPNFKPPPDYKTSKLYKKIFVPSKEYPGYNFVGLLLGPCGNTQKKMEKETGAKIRLRGRGSKLDTKAMQTKTESSDNEDLHVMIEADNKYSLDAAVAMVEKLLIPVDDGNNEHKLSQLRELAEIKGNLKANYTSNSMKPETCNVCGDTSHLTSSCPLIAATPGASSNGQKVNFAEMGSGLSPFNAQPPLSVCTIPSMSNSTSHASGPKKVINDANLFVGCLPQSMDENMLIELFSQFGPLRKVQVIRDKSTNSSKGYGFVMYADHISAAKAMAQMNGVNIVGKVLTVRIAGILPPPSQINQLPSYPGPSVIAQNNPPPICWPGPPESMLSETVASASNSSSYPVHRSPFSGQYSGSLRPSFQMPMTSSLFSGEFAASNELAQFPGYLKSLDSPRRLYHQATPSDSLSSSKHAGTVDVETNIVPLSNIKQMETRTLVGGTGLLHYHPLQGRT